jgi:hypothetical protein
VSTILAKALEACTRYADCWARTGAKAGFPPVSLLKNLIIFIVSKDKII